MSRSQPSVSFALIVTGFFTALLLSVEAHAADTDANVSVTIADRAKYDEVLAKHKGKVVLVDFWATWCATCVKQFPHTVELSKKHNKMKFAVISVSMDDAESKDHVLDFLKAKGAAFDNLLSKYEIGDEAFTAFDLGDSGVPHYKIYDAKGKLVKSLSKPDDIVKTIESLLKR